MTNRREEEHIIKVSVIVPVWNPGSGIVRCIDSLRNQTLTEIEIIFVDDCGTDDSMGKVHAAALEDPRIQIIKNDQNIGAGPSRNRGIESARGEYLSFIDPDDYIADNFLELLYLEAHTRSYDIIKGLKAFCWADGTIVYSEKKHRTIQKELLQGTPLYAVFTREHQTALYRREMVLLNNIRYGSTRRGQDVTFLLRVCFLAKSFSTVDTAYYYQCRRQNSMVSTLDKQHLEYYLDSIHEQVGHTSSFLPNDKHTAKYFFNLFISALSELYRYVGMEEMDESLPEYISKLREELRCLPCCNDLIQSSFSIYALDTYLCLLPQQPYHFKSDGLDSPKRWSDLVEKWIDCFLASPEKANACWTELKPVIIRANRAMNDGSHSRYSEEEQKQGKEILMRQIQRLPLGFRMQLNYIEFKKHVRLTIAKILPTRFKQAIKAIIHTDR